MQVIILEKSTQVPPFAEALNLKKVGSYFEGSFNNEFFRLVPLAGHVLELTPPDTINPNLKWDSIDEVENIPEVIPYRVDEKKSRYISSVKGALKGAKGIIFGGDPDREGVGLVFEVLEFLNINLPVTGVWLNEGLDPPAIHRAIKNRKKKDWFLPKFYAQQSRSVSDYYWMYLVRTYTYFGRNGALSPNLGSGGGKSSVVSVGRVQTALVAIIIERDELVISYKPIVFYNFNIKKDGVEFAYDHNVKLEDLGESLPGYIEDRETPYYVDAKGAEEFKKRLLDASNMSVTSSTKAAFTQNPPDPFSTKDLWSHCSKKLKYPTNKTQWTAEALYRMGFISYPRTKGKHIPKDKYSLAMVQETLNAMPEFIPKLQEDVITANQDEAFTPNAFRTVKEAHEGIIPTGKPISKLKMDHDIVKELKKKIGKISDNDLQTLLLNVYSAVFERFCITCLKPAIGYKCAVVATVDVPNLRGGNTSTFKTNSKFYSDLGYLIWHEPNRSLGNEDDLFIPQEGETIKFENVQVKKGKTAKYEHFNDETIVDGMTKISKKVDDPLLAKVLEKAKGIGTEATIVDILETVQAREYVDKVNGKFKATQKGKELIEVVENQLASPQLSAAWELRLSEIEEESDVTKAIEARDLFLSKQRYFIGDKIETIKSKYEDKVGTFKVYRGSSSGKPSPKQVEFAKSLSEKHGLSLSPKVLRSSVETSKWIDNALAKQKK